MKNMLKITALLLVLLMVIPVFAACGGEDETTLGDETTEAPTTETEDPRQTVKDTVPTDLKFDNVENNTVTFFVRADQERFLYELACEELKNDVLYDAIHYRNIDVENRLGVKIATVAQTGTWQERNAWNETLTTSVLTNTGDYDGTAFYIRASAGLAKDNIYYDLAELTDEFGGYLNFDQPWWNKSMRDDLAVGGALFFTGGDLTVSETQLLYTIFFNKDLFNEKFPEESVDVLYDAVRDGVWTIDMLTYYVEQVWDDVNSSGTVDDGDVVGWGGKTSTNDARADTWLYAMGLNPVTVFDDGSFEITMYNANTVPAWEKVSKLVNGTAGSYHNVSLTNDSLTLLVNGNQLFSHETVSHGETMRASTISYGVLPMPKYDEEQDGYHTTPATTASAIALCSNLSEERAIMCSAVLEILAAESYKQVTPTYYSKVLQGLYSKDQADAEMFDYILESSMLCFGYAYSYSISGGGMTNLFRSCGGMTDVQASIDGNRAKYETIIEELVGALMDAADN